MQSKESRRQLEIFNATGKILRSSGINGLTIKNLADAMHFSENAIYRYFSNEEQIITSMLGHLAQKLDQELNNVIRIGDSPMQKFKSLFHAQFSFFQKNQHLVITVFSDGLIKENQNINKIILKLISVNTKHLMPILMEGQQKGEFVNDITTEELMHIVIGAFRFRMYEWRMANFQFDIKRYGGFMIQSLLIIIKNRKC